MTGSIRNFEEKKNFSPKSRLNVQLKVKLPNLTDWHILPGQNRCPHRVSSSVSEPPNC